MKKIQNKLIELFNRYKHVWILSYFIIYLTWFGYLERTVTTHYHLIHLPIDDYIPFCEYFVIPYIMWFGYVALELLSRHYMTKRILQTVCVFIYWYDRIFSYINALPEWSQFKALLFYAPQYVYSALRVPLLYCHTDEPVSEHSRIQFARHSFCGDEQQLFQR